VIASAHIAAGVVSGAAAARYLRWQPGRIVASIGLGVIIHLGMDAVPHADYNGLVGPPLVAIVAVESIAMIIISYLLLRNRMGPGWIPAIVAGVFGSTVPDTKFFAPLLIPARYAQTVSDIGEQLHVSIHAEPTSFAVGMATQLIAIVLLVAIMAAFPGKRTT
jgi:hypothetical protein